ncbi:thiamine-phosphate kinase [Pseudoclavibacter albus]|uniref:thiamine-phosphate kinase n=1 Tax=Pseudoclavibacter albus TaxID=272241 RepID=UPI0008261A76|nr:thiamine-phosphate kinase [Pseudoclavibacter alba]
MPSTGTTVAQLGERGLLTRVLANIPASRDAELGAGDDAAVLHAPDGRVVITVDTMNEGPDFRRDWSSGEDLGRKAIASNLADIAAMGARPTGLVIALALPGSLPVAWVEEFARGLSCALDECAPGVGIVGGDLATAERIQISVTAFGDLEGRAPLVRSGARSGDVIALAGDAGRSAAGLALLAAYANDEPLEQLRESYGPGGAALVAAQLRPVAPIAAGPAAARAAASAMMDVSDGLLLDAHRMAEASNVTMRFERALLEPFAERLARELSESPGLPDDPLELVLRGGEDHALLATFPVDVVLPEAFTRIGEVLPPEPSRLLLDDEGREPIGWDPFSN